MSLNAVFINKKSLLTTHLSLYIVYQFSSILAPSVSFFTHISGFFWILTLFVPVKSVFTSLLLSHETWPLCNRLVFLASTDSNSEPQEQVIKAVLLRDQSSIKWIRNKVSRDIPCSQKQPCNAINVSAFLFEFSPLFSSLFNHFVPRFIAKRKWLMLLWEADAPTLFNLQDTKRCLQKRKTITRNCIYLYIFLKFMLQVRVFV